MIINRVKEEIRHTIEIYLQKNELGQYAIPTNKQRPLFLIGAPGIGKTAIVGQVAAEMNLGFVSYSITHHTRQSAIGLPYITKKTYGGQEVSITEYTLSEIIASVYEAIEKQNHKEGILFIDEINCVSETLAPAMLDLLQNKKFGPHKIPEGWVLVSAGNPVIFNKSAREFDTVTLDRIKKILVDTDYEMWKPYAYQTLIHNSVMYYLQMKPQNILRIEKSVNGDTFVTPRAWEDLSITIQNYLEKKYIIDNDVISHFIQHETIAHDFYNFFILFLKYQEKYQIKDIFEGKHDGWEKELKIARFDERVAFVHMISDYFNQLVNRWMTNKVKQEMLESMTRSIQNLPKADAITRLQRTMEMNSQILKNNILADRDKTARLWFADQVKTFHHQLVTGDITQAQIVEGSASSRKLLNDSVLLTVDQLSTALLFIDQVFGKSQEMVLLLMNMVTSQDILRFLSIHECPLFIKYNEELLVGERNIQLIREIESYKQSELNNDEDKNNQTMKA